MPFPYPHPQSIFSTLDGSKEARRFENGQNVIITVLGEDNKRERDSTLAHTKSLSEFKSDSHKPRLLTIHGALIACHMVVDTGDVIRLFNREKTRRDFIRVIFYLVGSFARTHP